MYELQNMYLFNRSGGDPEKHLFPFSKKHLKASHAHAGHEYIEFQIFSLPLDFIRGTLLQTIV